MRIKILTMTFKSTNKFEEGIESIRGFFASKFNEFVPLHNHKFNRLVYGYPSIQYKMVDSKPLIMGINEGIDILINIFDKYDNITLNNKSYQIIEKSITIRNQDFGLTKGIHFYEFVTPWLALNEKNFEKYLYAGDVDSKAEILRKVLIANLISMSKATGYTVPGKIQCDIDLMTKKEKFEYQDFISCTGGFMVNFYIPDFLGIGKSVSKGHGTIRQIDSPR
ncbi:MAG: hypothetical protein L6265_12060 [Thermoplasmatales archaeon]|nr:hypothetical protein [Candidatus Methanoperedenaceae archaeon]MCG2827314.1 hypothetical protein [Thermoplasmatales archaeon]